MKEKKYSPIDVAKIFWRETWRGKGVGRILGNLAFSEFTLSGDVLDFGSSHRASYHRFFKISEPIRFVNIDINPQSKADYILDMEKDAVPLADGAFDSILMLGLLEHMSNYDNIMNEACRLLKPSGKLVVSVPFLKNVHPDPHDYFRFTEEKIRQILSDSNFTDIKISIVGFGPFMAAYSIIEFMLCRPFRIFILPFVFLLDSLAIKIKPNLDLDRHYPLAYVVSANK